MRRKARAVLVLAVALPAAVAATPASAAPKRPTSLRATAITTTSVTLAWRDRARNETRYELRAGSRRDPAAAQRARRDRGRARSPTPATRSGCAPAGAAPAPPSRSRWRGSRATRAASGRRSWAAARCSRPRARGTATSAPTRSTATRRVHRRVAGRAPRAPRLRLDASGSTASRGRWCRRPLPTSTARITYGTDGADYGDESDHGPMPIPLSAPIEGWDGPGHDPDGGDRHVIALQQGSCKLYELYNAVRTQHRLPGLVERRLRPHEDDAAAGRLDVGRRRRPADLPGPAPLRRGGDGRDPARDPVHGAAGAARVRDAGAPSRHPGEPGLPAVRRATAAARVVPGGTLSRAGAGDHPGPEALRDDLRRPGLGRVPVGHERRALGAGDLGHQQRAPDPRRRLRGGQAAGRSARDWKPSGPPSGAC